MPPPGWLGEVMAGGAALPRLRWRGARGRLQWSRGLLEPVGAGLSSLFARLRLSAGDSGGWQARSLALLLSHGHGARVVLVLLASMGLALPLPVGYCPCGLSVVCSAPS